MTLALCASGARADTDNWQGVGGSWLWAGGWTTGHVPAPSDTVTITNPNGASVSYEYAGTVTAASLASFTLGSGAGTDTFTMPATPAYAFSTTNLTVAASGSFVQNAGSVTVTRVFNVTSGSSGAAGTYTLVDGSLNAASATESVAGGVFMQSGGTHTVGGSGGSDGFFIKAGGVYNLAGGTLVPSFATVTGAFNQSGGANVPVRGLTVDGQAAGNAYTLSGGALVTGSASNLLAGATVETIGYSGAGSFVQTGGSHTVNFNLVLASNIGSVGNYALSGGSLLIGGTAVIGGSGTANFSQTGGQVQAAGVTLASGSGGVSRYALAAGSLATPNLTVGGNGTFTVGGGSALVSGTLALGTGGTNLIAGLVITDGLLDLSHGTNLIGYSGRATVLQSGGTHSAAALFIGYNYAGTYGLTGGVLSVSGNEEIGWGGPGVFVQDGGANAAGTFDLRGGGNYTLNGGAMSTGGSFYVGSGSSFGYFTQTGGQVSSRLWEIGGQGNGVLTQSGGTNAVASFTQFSNGTVTLSGSASLAVSGTANVGGLFSQAGGKVSAGSLVISYYRPVYTLSAGTLTAGNLSVGVANAGLGTSGTFVQLGGAATITGPTSIGAGGTVNLLGGVFSAASVTNGGRLAISGGIAMATSLSGTGSALVGGGTGVARLTLNTLNLATLSVSNNGSVAFLMAARPATNVVTTALSLAGNATLDLANTNLFAGGASNVIRQFLTQGYDHGAWDGPGGGIISSTAASSGATLGYAVPGDHVAAGVNLQGRTLVAYTLPGDADLNGIVDFRDFMTLQNAFGQAGDWTQGDFNYDGVVDSQDFELLQQNFGQSLASRLSSAATPAAVPEPAGCTVVVLAWAALAARRRGRAMTVGRPAAKGDGENAS